MTSLKASLTKAKARLFGTATKDIAVPFELPCDCGHRVTGIRRGSYQIATCTACDARVYVLAVNVYPATKRVSSEVLDGSVASRLSTIVRDLVVGDQASSPASQSATIHAPPPGQHRSGSAAGVELPAAESEVSGVTKFSGKRSRLATTQPKVSAAAAALAASEILLEAPVVRVPRPRLAVVMRRVFTPFRLLMLSATLLVAVTGWWMVTQRRLEDARKAWRREMDVAEQALEDKDLGALHLALSKAVAAGSILQRNDPEWRRAASLLRQTQAVRDLSSSDLISMLSGCVSGDGIFNSPKATAAAESLTGKWFVLECGWLPVANGLQADMPLMVDSVPVTITTLSETLLHAVAALPQSPLMFVASVESCDVIDNGREFQLRLNGKSATLITTEYHAAEMGFTAANTPGLAALLEKQTELLKSVSQAKDNQP